MSALARALLVALVALAASAHVGSPDAWYEGAAGPYRVLVHVAAPGVIPGIATVRVRVEGGAVERVTAVADHVASTGGAPPPEPLEPDPDEPGWYRTRLWIMTTGSYSVTVAVAGPLGSGSAVVPLAAVASRRLGFGRGLGVVLATAGLVLLAGLLTIVGAAVRQGVLPPGDTPDPARRRAAGRAVARSALVLGVLLVGGWRWWQIEDERYVRSMFRPMSATAAVGNGEVTLAIQDSSWIMRHDEGWRRSRPGAPPPELLADHGKVMHLFMVGAGGGAFAHLHPRTDDSVRFRATIPPLPAGRYSLFGDIVQETGFTQTLVASLDLDGTGPDTLAGMDPDDSWAVVDAPAVDGTATLADGSTLAWLGADETLVAGRPAALQFALTPPPGGELALEPYMGMSAHAVVVREDHGVFVHIHPMGTISMAAQQRLSERSIAADAAPAADALHGAHETRDASATISFPYAFPTSGRYVVWVQLKRQGRVLTASFETRVGAP